MLMVVTSLPPSPQTILKLGRFLKLIFDNVLLNFHDLKICAWHLWGDILRLKESVLNWWMEWVGQVSQYCKHMVWIAKEKFKHSMRWKRVSSIDGWSELARANRLLITLWPRWVWPVRKRGREWIWMKMADDRLLLRFPLPSNSFKHIYSEEKWDALLTDS